MSRVQELESQLKSFVKSPHMGQRTSASADGAPSEDSAILGNYHQRSSFASYSPTSMPVGGGARDQGKTDGVDGMGAITLSDNGTFSSYFGRPIYTLRAEGLLTLS